MRSVLTTLAELLGLVAVVVAVMLAVGVPWLPVALGLSGASVALTGYLERP